jgi:hypothetical protein
MIMSDNTNGEIDPQRPAPAPPNPQTGHPGFPSPAGGYPDPAVPPVYPTPAMPGDPYATNSAPGYTGYGAPSAFAGPPSAAPGPGGLVITALVVGIVAFLAGWVPVLGVLFGIAGIIVGIMALRRPSGKGFAIAGIVLSSLGLISSLIVTLVLFLFIPTGMVYY